MTAIVSDTRSVENLDSLIVGAGLAGLTASYLASKNNISAPIYEATNRTGGLIQTADVPRLGRIDLGAEYIDSGHKHIQRLCKLLDVDLVQIYNDSSTGPDVSFVVNGISYTGADFQKASQSIVDLIKKDHDLVLARSSRVQELNHLSVKEYLNEMEAPAWVKSAFLMVHETEYGAAASELSVIGFLQMGYDKISARCPSIYGPGYGQFLVKGGTSEVIKALSINTDSLIQTGNPLIAIEQLSDGRYELTFANSTVKTDKVVLATPLPSLRNVDLSKSGLPDHQLNAIKRIQYGRSTKMFFGFKPSTTALLPTGETYIDLLGGTVWNTGATDKSGSEQTLALLRGGPACDWENDPEILINYLLTVFPSLRDRWLGSFASFEYNSNDPYQGGSWIAVSPDQEDLLSSLRTPHQGICFAGAHIGEEYGYMDAAVESAKIANNFILNRLS
jgi:monoamine oxidase